MRTMQCYTTHILLWKILEHQVTLDEAAFLMDLAVVDGYRDAAMDQTLNVIENPKVHRFRA